MARLVRYVLLGTVGAVLAACGGGPPGGTVTGHAAVCLGPHRTQAQIAAIPVRVEVTQHSRPVASATVRGSHTYRFRLAPGRYAVSSGAGRSVPVVVRPGSLLRVDLADFCR